MTVRKFIWALGTTVLLATGLVLTFGPSAGATYDHPPDDCVPTEDHFQRYSWTGGPHEGDDPPAFPSDDWQPNVEGDPHDIGVPGAYFVSHGGSGNGDWFYLELVPGTECPPDDPPPTTVPTTEPPPTTECPDENGRETYTHPPTTECPPVTTVPPTTVPPTTVPPTTVPPTTVPPTTVPPTTVPPTTIPPPTTEPPPPTTEVPPPTTVVPPPPSTVPTCEDDPTQNGCAPPERLARTGDNHDDQVKWGIGFILAGLLAAFVGKKRLTA